MIKLIRSPQSRMILAGFLVTFTALSLFKMYKAYIFAYHYIGSMPFNPRPPFYFWLATSLACGLFWFLGVLLVRKTAQQGGAVDAGTSGPRH